MIKYLYKKFKFSPKGDITNSAGDAYHITLFKKNICDTFVTKKKGKK
jgi:hypothetical protein